MAVISKNATIYRSNTVTNAKTPTRVFGSAGIYNAIDNVLTWVLLVSTVLAVLVKVALLLCHLTFELANAILIVAMVGWKVS